MNRKNPRRSLGIGAKTLLSHLFLAITVIVMAAVVSYTITTSYVRESRTRDLNRKVRLIADNALRNGGGEFAPSRRAVQLVEEIAGAQLIFLANDRNIVRLYRYGNESEPEGTIEQVVLTDPVDLEYMRRILDGETVSALRRFEFMQEDIIFAGAPILEPSGKTGGVLLVQPASEMRSLSTAIRLMIIATLSVALLLSIILASYQTRVLVRPIERITRAAARMEAGVYAERITGLANDEIGDLGRALNSMSERLVDVIGNLRRERDKLELVVSGIGEGLIAVDTEWNAVHVNSAFWQLTELDRVDALLREDSDPRLEPVKSLLSRCMQTGAAGQAPWTNPSDRALLATASAIVDESGAIQGAVCLVRDVSESQRMEQLRRDYVANISHELRTPLTGIRGMVEPLIDGYMDTEEERQDSYRVILKETIRLEKLVGEMLDMSRLQDGRVTVELEPMELPGILEAAARSMRGIAEESGVQLKVETDGTKLACMGNEDRIMQVLVILIDNALSFTPAGGCVTVFARDEGDRIDVGVRDTGCGIEPKDLPYIWERFYKADKSRMRTTGTGLGLSIAKLVTQLMGGEIGAESEPGKGSVFTFTLKKV